MVFDSKIKRPALLGNLLLSGRMMIPLTGIMVLLSGFRAASFSQEHLLAGGPPIANTLLISWFSGAVLGPLLLPWLPGRSVATKGLMAGLLGLLLYPAACFFLHLEPLDVLMALLVIPSATSLLMVILSTPGRLGETPRPAETKEFSTIIPIQLALVALAAGIWMAARFI